MFFSELASYFHKLETTASRNAMTGILSDLFLHSTADEIGQICYLLQGRVEPLYEPVEFGVADKFILRAIVKANNTDMESVISAFKETGDLGEAAQRVDSSKRKSTLTVHDVYTRLYGIAKESGVGSQEKKIGELASLIADADPLSVRFIVRIPVGKLRLGFSDMTILDGLSWMLTGDKSARDKLEAIYNIRPDIGVLAATVKRDGLAGLGRIKAKVGAPILACLCQRLPTADEMIKKMGKVVVEPKYDGVRVQIHFKRNGFRILKTSVQTFSRNLENTTEMFPELQAMGKFLKADEVILDSEAVGIDPKSGKIVSFQETTTRKRKHDIAEAQKNLPLRFFVFDILLKDGAELLSTSLQERKKILSSTLKPNSIIEISEHIVTDNPEVIRKYHKTQRDKGLEGAVVKKLESPYEPGRRGYSWVKFKEEEGKTGKLTDTIDGVVMGYYQGEGKRAGFGIGAFLVGVRNEEKFVTITKIGTGVSDELWKDLKTQFHALASKEKPKEYSDVDKIFTPDIWVIPKLVVEVAGDDLTKSPTHGAGVAIRFPRLVRIRTDKNPHMATTVREVQDMYALQKA